MLIAVDIGNTNTTFGLFETSGESPLRTWRSASVRDRTSDEWSVLIVGWLRDAGISPELVSGMAVSSVSPSIGSAITSLGPQLFKTEAMTVSTDLDLGIQIGTEEPHLVGADRLVTSSEAFRRFGGPVIVVDMGTATKIEAIDVSGRYLGGVIAPGLGLTMESLASRAAQLFAVPLTLPEHAIGTTTINSVQAGVVTGHLAMIEGMVGRVRDELGGAQRVILTGGFSYAIAGESSLFTDTLPDLILEGLAVLYRRNRP